MVTNKRGPKRPAKSVQTRRKLLAIHKDRAARGLSWREIERKHGLISRNGMSARNIYLRAERLLERNAS